MTEFANGDNPSDDAKAAADNGSGAGVNGQSQEAPPQQKPVQVVLSPHSIAISLFMAALETLVSHLVNSGVAPVGVLNILLEMCANIIARHEPKIHRDKMVMEIRRNIQGTVDKQYARLHSTPNGIIIPSPGVKL